MASYAGQKGWTELQYIPTTGHIGVNGYSEVMVVSQLTDEGIDSILLKINSRGLVVGTSDRTFTGPT